MTPIIITPTGTRSDSLCFHCRQPAQPGFIVGLSLGGFHLCWNCMDLLKDAIKLLPKEESK
jgi:hypothetical protein